MSSNFPYIPTGVPLPSAPQSNDQLISWAGSIGLAIQHLSRIVASRLSDMSNADIHPFASGDVQIPTENSMIFAGVLRLTGTQQIRAYGTAILRGI